MFRTARKRFTSAAATSAGFAVNHILSNPVADAAFIRPTPAELAERRATSGKTPADEGSNAEGTAQQECSGTFCSGGQGNGAAGAELLQVEAGTGRADESREQLSEVGQVRAHKPDLSSEELVKKLPKKAENEDKSKADHLAVDPDDDEHDPAFWDEDHEDAPSTFTRSSSGKKWNPPSLYFTQFLIGSMGAPKLLEAGSSRDIDEEALAKAEAKPAYEYNPAGPESRNVSTMGYDPGCTIAARDFNNWHYQEWDYQYEPIFLLLQEHEQPVRLLVLVLCYCL